MFARISNMFGGNENMSNSEPSSTNSHSESSTPIHCDGGQAFKIDNSSSILEKIANLYAESLMSDIILVVGDKKFHAHRLILCASSDVFEVMLMNPHWSDSQKQSIYLQEAPECMEVFEMFLKYLYTGQLKITHRSVLPVLGLADKYNVKDLINTCCKYMKEHIVSATKHNYLISWLQYTMACGHQDIAQSCMNHLKWNFEQVAKTEDFATCDVTLLTALLSQNDIVIEDELSLYNHIVNWLQHQETTLPIVTPSVTPSGDTSLPSFKDLPSPTSKLNSSSYLLQATSTLSLDTPPASGGCPFFNERIEMENPEDTSPNDNVVNPAARSNYNSYKSQDKCSNPTKSMQSSSNFSQLPSCSSPKIFNTVNTTSSNTDHSHVTKAYAADTESIPMDCCSSVHQSKSTDASIPMEHSSSSESKPTLNPLFPINTLKSTKVLPMNVLSSLTIDNELKCRERECQTSSKCPRTQPSINPTKTKYFFKREFTCSSADPVDQMEYLTYEVMRFIRFPMMTPRQLADLLLDSLTIKYKEFFVTRMAIGMSFHSGQWVRINEVLNDPDISNQLLFTPRLYTAEKWSAGLTVDNLPSLPAYHTRTLFFTTPASASELDNDTQLEWIVELYPKGVWFKKFLLIVWHGTVEVPEAVLRTVRLSVTAKDADFARVRISVLVYGVEDGIEHVVSVVSIRHIFTADDTLLNMDDIISFDTLNNAVSGQKYLVEPCSALKIHVVINPLSDPKLSGKITNGPG